MAKQAQQPPDDSSEQTGRTGVLTVVDLDGLPAVDPEAAAARVAAYLSQRDFGPNTQALVAYIAERAVDTADLNVVILEQLSERLLAATTPDEILMPLDPKGCEEYLGRPLQIEAASFLESDFSEGFPWYTSLTVTVLDTGESAVITIGGEKVMYQVAAFSYHDAWPVTCVIHRRTRATKAGFYPLELRPVGKASPR